MKYKLSLLILLFFIKANSQITFTEIYHEYDIPDLIDEAIHGDLNGDGVDDFVTSSYIGGKLQIGINENLQKPDFTTINEGADIRFLTLHDIDQDNDLDIIGSAVFDNLSYCWKNDNNGNFISELLPINNYNSIHFADLDGDNITEMILGIDQKIKVLRQIP